MNNIPSRLALYLKTLLYFIPPAIVCVAANKWRWFYHGTPLSTLLGLISLIGFFYLLWFLWGIADAISLMTRHKHLVGENPHMTDDPSRRGGVKLAVCVTVLVILSAISYIALRSGPFQGATCFLYTVFLATGTYFITQRIPWSRR